MRHIDEIQCYFGRQIAEIQPNMKAGAIGAHTYAVQDCRKDFDQLSLRVASVCGIEVAPKPLVCS